MYAFLIWDSILCLSVLKKQFSIFLYPKCKFMWFYIYACNLLFIQGINDNVVNNSSVCTFEVSQLIWFLDSFCQWPCQCDICLFQFCCVSLVLWCLWMLIHWYHPLPSCYFLLTSLQSFWVSVGTLLLMVSIIFLFCLNATVLRIFYWLELIWPWRLLDSNQWLIVNRENHILYENGCWCGTSSHWQHGYPNSGSYVATVVCFKDSLLQSLWSFWWYWKCNVLVGTPSLNHHEILFHYSSFPPKALLLKLLLPT